MKVSHTNLIKYNDLRSVYVNYKIKAFDRQVRELILIGKRDLCIKEKEITLEFELNQIQNPEDCMIEINSLKLNFFDGNVKELKIEKTFSLPEIHSYKRIDFD